MKTIKYCPFCKRIDSDSLTEWHHKIHFSDWKAHREAMFDIEDLRWDPVICRDLFWYFVGVMSWKDGNTLPSRFWKWEPEFINYI